MYRFDAFTLSVEARTLLEGRAVVRLGARAFDLLAVLVARPGEVVSHDELLARVWADTHVDERSLRVHVSALRKILGEARTGVRCIANVPGRGYAFVRPVAQTRDVAADVEPAMRHDAAVAASAPLVTQPCPVLLTRTIGREAFVTATAAELSESRFVSIVGPGGVGKTTVAITLAERIAHAYADGVCYADLAPLAHGALLPSAMASLLGLGSYSEDPVPGLVAALRARSLLLVLDNCERVVDAAASLSERILAGARRVHVLTTSREPLRASGEWVRRLAPLENAPDRAVPSAEALLAYSAVQLFVERARASTRAFDLTDENAPVVAALCRQLEGVPLAIELAAARFEELGLGGLARGLADRFALLSRGRRTAPPRQRTLRDLLDWSYLLLAPTEQATLRRIGVFAGEFRQSAAIDVGAFGELSRDALAEGLANLVAKSLVAVDVSGDVEQYRLLDMTREYARAKLGRGDEHACVARRHAEAQHALFVEAERAWASATSAGWLKTYGRSIDDVRAAIAWSFSPSGDAHLGISLTMATYLLWTQLALMGEYRGLVEQALARNAALDAPDSAIEARLAGALGNLLFHTKGPLADAETSAAFDRSYRAAVAANDRSSQLFALSGACAVQTTLGDYPAALALADRFDESLGLAGMVAKQRARAHVLHYLGELDRCQAQLDAAAHALPASSRIRSSGVAYDHRVTIESVQARMHWLRGDTDRAVALSRACIAYARSLDHGVSLCLALVMTACPLEHVAFGREAAQPYIELLWETATKHSMVRAQRYAEIYDLTMTRRDARRAPELATRMAQLVTAPIDGPQLGNVAVLGDDFVDPRLVARAAAGTGEWCRAELLRIEGEATLGLFEDDRDDARARASAERVACAEALFRRSLDLARAQRARAWELRAATSLARLLRDLGRGADARTLLAGVHGSLTEGLLTRDAVAAQQMLATLA